MSNELINVVAMASAAAAAAALGSPVGIPISTSPVDDSKPESETNLAAKQESVQTAASDEKPKRLVINVTPEPNAETEVAKVVANAKNTCRETLQLFQDLAATNPSSSGIFTKTSKTCSNISTTPVASHMNAQRCSLDIELGLNLTGNEECRGLTTDVLGLPLNMGASLNNPTLVPDLMMANIARKEEICRDLVKNSNLSDKDMLVLDALDNIYREW